MRVLMAGGGTGGHIYPAIAVADMIMADDSHSVVEFIATKNGLEKKLVREAGYITHHVEMSGFQRSFSLKNIKTAVCMITAPKQCRKLIEEFDPDMVFGTGGYLCWPLLSEAKKLGIPVTIHESNAIPGKATLMLEDAAEIIFTNFESTANYLKPSNKHKVLRYGNPLRIDPVPMSREEARNKLGIDSKYKYILLTFGGSRGSLFINKRVADIMDRYTSKHPDILHIHATGIDRYDEFMKDYNLFHLSKHDNIIVKPYIDDMPLWESASDCALTRAGSMTISELSLLGTPTILIPSPNVANNHQYENAKRLEDANACILMEEKKTTSGALALAIDSIIYGGRSISLSKNIRTFATPNAKERIVEELNKLSSGYSPSIVDVK